MTRQRLAAIVPTLVAAFVAAWYGYDFAVLRAGSASAFTYYGSLDDALVGDVRGWLALVGAALMIGGVCCRREFVTRIGYLLAGLSFWVFSIGFIAQSLVFGENLTSASAVSSMTPGLTYGLLGLWMILTAATRWDATLDPHVKRRRRS